MADKKPLPPVGREIFTEYSDLERLEKWQPLDISDTEEQRLEVREERQAYLTDISDTLEPPPPPRRPTDDEDKSD